MFIRHCKVPKAFTVLVRLSTWQYPWPIAVFIERLEVARFPSSAMSGADRIVDMHALLALPAELSEQIWDCARPNEVEKYGAVLDLVDVVSNATGEVTEVSLSHVYAWHRGIQPTIQEKISNPVIRMAIDARGLFMIERLSEPPQDHGVRSETLVYIVEQAHRLSEAIVQFMVGKRPILRSHIVVIANTS